MKTYKRIVSASFLTLVCIWHLSSTHHAVAGEGGQSGGGGVAVVCMNPDSVEMLDILEAREQYKLKVTKRNIPVDRQIESALARLKSLPEHRAHLDRFLTSFQKQVRYIDKDFGLTPISDVEPALTLPVGCRYEQLARYQPDGMVLVNSKYFNLMSPTDQAALVLHEIVYAMSRFSIQAKTSVSARKLVGYLMADSLDSLADLKELAMTALGPRWTDQIGLAGTINLFHSTHLDALSNPNAGGVHFLFIEISSPMQFRVSNLGGFPGKETFRDRDVNDEFRCQVDSWVCHKILSNSSPGRERLVVSPDGRLMEHYVHKGNKWIYDVTYLISPL